MAADDFARSSGVDYGSCGHQRLFYDASCCPMISAGYDCLLAALESCSPMRLAEVYGTVEGATIFRDYFVVPLASGCELVEVGDDGQDRFRGTSYPAVSKRHCRIAWTLPAASAETCASLQVHQCNP